MPGEYFITICTHNHECLLGEIVKEEMQLSQIGTIAHQCLTEVPKHFPNAELGEYIVMPNHIHAIIVMTEGKDLIHQIPFNPDVIPIDNIYRDVPTEWMMMKNPQLTLGKIVRDFKAHTTKIVHDAGFLHFRWQSKFYDYIIRNEQELNNIRDYIARNILQWTAEHSFELPENIFSNERKTS
jgi:REP element-mobilizing transposase RayT